MQKEAAKRADKHSSWLHNEEVLRQETERKMLNRSLALMLDEFKSEWKHKKTLLDEHCERLMMTVSAGDDNNTAIPAPSCDCAQLLCVVLQSFESLYACQVRERAEAQRHNLEKKYEVQRVPPVKYSTNTRDMVKQVVSRNGSLFQGSLRILQVFFDISSLLVAGLAGQKIRGC